MTKMVISAKLTHIMELRDICLIIGSIISLGALIVSIIALCVNGKREKSRKLRDVIIEEMANLQREILSFLTPIVRSEEKYSCQDVISWFKLTVRKIEAICTYTKEKVTLDDKDLENIAKDVQELRTYLTEAESFCKSYSSPSFILQGDEIVEVEKYYASIYKSFLSAISKVNGAKRR